MKNTAFYERLNLALDKEKFPPKNYGRIQLLAEMIGLTHRGASKWVNGESSPPAKKYADLAKKLGVNETWLRTGEGTMLDNGSKTELPSINSEYLREVNLFRLDNILSPTRTPLKTIKTYIQPHQTNCFGVTIETEAMSPRFPVGSIAIFEETIKANDGDFVLVNYDAYPEPIFRQLLITSSSMYLIAHNPKFERLTFNDSHQILGRLIQATLTFS